jgi:hypothetical protein
MNVVDIPNMVSPVEGFVARPAVIYASINMAMSNARPAAWLAAKWAKNGPSGGWFSR